MAGRPRKPTALRVLQGNAGKRPLPKDEPRVPPGEPVCPDWLGVEERKLWEEYAPTYRSMGCLTVADVPAFAAWMCELAKIKLAQREREPVPVSVSKLAMSYAVQFGGTPAGRARVTVKPEKKEDPLAALIG